MLVREMTISLQAKALISVDGGSGFDVLNLDFGNNYSGVTSSLSDSNSGEYISDEGIVEFSNIEAVNIFGSSYDDILVAPVGNANLAYLPLIPMINGGAGMDELVVDYSNNNRDHDLIIDSNYYGILNTYDYQTGNNTTLNFSEIESFNITTGRGNNNIDLGYDNYSDDIVDAGAGDDYISTGKGFDLVDGGSGFDVLNLDFGNNYSGVTSSLSDSNSGEYISDEGIVEFSNIEAVNIFGSSYDDVLVAPVGNANLAYLPLIPMINGGAGMDELVVDYSNNNRDHDLIIDSNYYGSLNTYDYQTGNNTTLNFSEIESFNITTGRGNNNIDRGYDNYSDDIVDAGAGDDYISTGKGFDLVDGGSGFDVLNLDFGNNYSGVTSSLSDSNSGEYISDEGIVEFSNIEAVNIFGSSYDDVLVAPVGNANLAYLPLIPMINGGAGMDELVVDYSNNNRDHDLIIDSNYYGSLNTYDYQTGNNTTLNFSEIESFNITTGRGNNNIDLGYDNYSDDIVDAGAGDDYISTGKGFDLVDGGSGFDILNLDFGNNYSGVTSSLSDSNSGEYTNNEDTFGVAFDSIEAINVMGSSEDDILHGLRGKDTIYGEMGADTILGGNGDDMIDGGEGADSLLGSQGDDLLDGGAGIDTIRGGDDRDIIAGNEDDDLLFGDAGNDTIDGGLGNDSLRGGDNDDILLGGIGIDTIRGEAGNDLINGNDERDLLFGDAGNDTIDGGNGDDLLRGGDNNDILFGGAGKDVLFGDGGTDIFVLELNSSFDVIKDFNYGEDKFGLTSGLSFNDLSISSNSLGSAAVIRNVDDNEAIALAIGVDPMNITDKDFVNV